MDAHFLSIPLCGSQLCFAGSHIFTALKKFFTYSHHFISLRPLKHRQHFQSNEMVIQPSSYVLHKTNSACILYKINSV